MKAKHAQKRAQSMSINTIIVAAIALVVLLVMIAIFSGRVSLFNRGLGSCKGYCSQEPVCNAGFVGVPTRNCNDGTNPALQGDGLCCVETG